MTSFKEFVRQRRRFLLWTAGLVCLYSLLGFVALPWLVERQLVATLQQRLGANASVEAIRFNPFTFAASVDALSVHSTAGEPLLSLQRLYVNVEPSRLLLLKMRLAELRIDTLQLHYSRYTETDNTVARLAQRWAATAAPASTTESEATTEAEATAESTSNEAVAQDDALFPLEIGRFQYLNGSIHYRDEVPQTDFSTTLGPLNIDVANLSTLDSQEKGIKDLVLQIEQDATLTWSSQFGLSPLQFTGHLALKNFSLTTPYRYLQDSLPFVLRDGRVATEFDYFFSIDQSAGPRLELSNLGVQVSALDAIENGAAAAFLAGGKVTLENGSFVYPNLRAQAAALRVDGVRLDLVRDAQGVLNLQRLLSSFTGEATPAVDEPANPLQLTLNEFALVNTTVNFTDSSTQTPAVFSVQTQASLQNFTLTPGAVLPFNASLTLAAGGALSAQGKLQLFPALDVDTMLELADLSLKPLQPYLDDVAQLTLDSGLLGFTARLRSNASEALAWQGDLTLNTLQLLDQQRTETLLSLAALRADNVDLSLTNKRLDISELVLDALYSRVFIDENGATNIGQALKPARPQAAAPTSAKPAADKAATPFAITLGRMQIKDASSAFTDRNLPIVFDTKMHALNGEVSGFSSNSRQPIRLDLEGQVDDFGLVEIKGSLTPLEFTRQTKVALAFTNLALPSITPYAIKFAGREIAEGKVDVTLDYAIANSELQASNSVVLRDLRLGPKVDYPGAMNLPLDLAVALLKNREGVIDLNVPLSGNVNDPQFDFGPAIRQAIFNIIVNIVTSPFRLLGSLIGGGEEEIDSIRFRPGRSDLALPEQEKLQKLLSALAQRPQLALTIPAPYDTAADTLALQESTVDARIAAQLTLDAPTAQLPERRLAVLEALYTAAMLTPTLAELRVRFTPVASTEAEVGVEEAPILDALAYTASLREHLIAAEPVNDAQLQSLARERQSIVSAYFVASGEIEAKRLQNADVATAELEEGWLSAGFEVAVAE